MATKVKLGTDAQWGVKENGVLGFNDENGVFKAIELASSRASGATYVAESGLIADAEVGVPRIDWTNGVGELLLEPQSTNLITRSEDLSTTWVQYGTTSVNTNSGSSPDGNVTADEITGATDIIFSSNNIAFFSSVSSSTTYTGSVYVKLKTATTLTLRLRDGSTGATQDITTTDTSGWVRLSNQLTTGGATTTISFILGASDGTFEVWGAQLEEQSYPTSYIRTSGSSVTRIADAVSGNSSLGQVINSSEGVLYFEGSSDSAALAVFWGLNDGGTSNRVFMGYSGSVLFGRTVNPSDDVNVSGAITATNNNKCAIRWTSSELSLWANGVELGSSILTDTPNNLDTLEADSGAGSNPFYGRIRELKVYDTALTDAELTTLTTI